MNAQEHFCPHLRPLCVAFCLLALSVGAAAQDNGESAQIYRQGYNLVLDEDWQGAITAFDQFMERFPAGDWSDDAGFWRCYARQQLDHPAAEVFDCFECDTLDGGCGLHDPDGVLEPSQVLLQ